MHARSRPLVGKYAFTVHDLSLGIRQAKFQQATGLEMTLNQGEHQEGGAVAPMKEITTVAFGNVTFQHGVFENTELYDWVTTCINMLAHMPEGAGVASPDQLRNFSIRQLRRDRTTLRRTQCYNCQPARFTPGEHDNTSPDVQVEELEMSMEFFTIAT